MPIISFTLILSETILSLYALGDFSCRNGWTLNPANGQCYHISEQYASFDNAEKSCKEMSSTLASIQSFDEHLFILPLLFIERTMCTSFDDCSKYWIGLRSQLGRLVWTDGSTLSKNISFWEKEIIPSDLQTLPCVYLNLNENLYELSGYWKNEDCGMPRRYICKKVSDCPVGFFHVNGVSHCYKLNAVPAPWSEASTMCKNLHPRSTLATVTSSAESVAVTNFLKIEFSKNRTHCILNDGNHGQNVWIGGQRNDPKRCNTPFVWKPTHNVELPIRGYTNWFRRQPDCGGRSETCMHISQKWGYKWNDEVCVTSRCSLCQASF